MEIRVLRYFLAVAREETILAAAESLHVTQPTLSRQLMELPDLAHRLILNLPTFTSSLFFLGISLYRI